MKEPYFQGTLIFRTPCRLTRCCGGGYTYIPNTLYNCAKRHYVGSASNLIVFVRSFVVRRSFVRPAESRFLRVGYVGWTRPDNPVNFHIISEVLKK